MVVEKVLVNVKGIVTSFLITRELDVSASADSELPAKDSVRNQ